MKSILVGPRSVYRRRGDGNRVREQPGAECKGRVLGGCHSGGSETGAGTSQAALHLKLAEEQVQSAKRLIRDNDNKRAEYVLMRAQADAELAIALSHVAVSNVQAGTAVDEARAVHSGTPTP